MVDIPNKSEYVVHKMKCPGCNSENANVITHLLDIPHYEDYTMVAINCPECHLRVSDFFHSEPKGHTISTYTVTGPEDQNTKIVRASEGIVKIPELGVSIDPVTGSNTWLRNIEGVLEDIKSKLIIALKGAEDDEMRDNSITRIELVNKFLNYDLPFTIIVEDISGNSIILPAIQNKLQVEEISDLQ